MPQEHGAGFVLFRREGKGFTYLILHRSAFDQWDFPRGEIDKGETPEQGAHRETLEETGIKGVKQIAGFQEVNEWFFRREGKTYHKDVKMFLGEAPTDKVTLSVEHDQHKWLLYEEALKTLSNKGAKEVLKKAHWHLNSGLIRWA